MDEWGLFRVFLGNPHCVIFNETNQRKASDQSLYAEIPWRRLVVLNPVHRSLAMEEQFGDWAGRNSQIRARRSLAWHVGPEPGADSQGDDHSLVVQRGAGPSVRARPSMFDLPHLVRHVRVVNRTQASFSSGRSR